MDSAIPASLDIASLEEGYRQGALTPAGVMADVHGRIARRGKDGVWIHLVPADQAISQARALERRRREGEALPLYGIPFAVKDNIDVADLPTTAACPDFAYVAAESATAVRLLLGAGAMLVGKTNLDQFATGLVGVRSPYGVCPNPFDSRYIAGGSSSGSAVAVSAGLVSFALGTDTAGSGRVPAALTNIVGLKPTRGLISTRGVVPACRSLDCVSVFALTCADAQRAADVLRHRGGAEPHGRAPAAQLPDFPRGFRFGVPRPSRREFFGDPETGRLYDLALGRLAALGGSAVEIDFEPFRKAGELLYSGPWVAERLQALEAFLISRPEAFHPVTARIIGGGSGYRGTDVFRGLDRLESLRCEALAQWELMDCLVLPTAGTHYTIDAVEAHPIVLNTNLGLYTSFANLLDLCGVAVPAGFYRNGLPFGISVLGRAFADDALVRLAARFHRSTGGRLGATDAAVDSAAEPAPAAAGAEVLLAVVGAHLRGQPLNPELTSRAATFRRTQRTSPGYRLFALAGTAPPKPGLVRAPGASGPGIEVEVWSLGRAAFGDFVASVPAPMAIGNVELADGTTVKGFVCEPCSLAGAEDITAFGGWRAYLGRTAG